MADAAKRALDLTSAFVGLILLSPLLVAVAVAIKLHDGGPVFYRGIRVGWHGNHFKIFKFRTMVVRADKIGGSSTPDDDARITRVGNVLRRYKFDELPQLINVLVGDMSVVGPRPQVQWAVGLYTEEDRVLLTVRPGMTDYSSLRFLNEGAVLRGSADPDKYYLEEIHPQKVRLGLEYVARHSLWIDVKIIVATIGALVGVDPTWCLPFFERTSKRGSGSVAPS